VWNYDGALDGTTIADGPGEAIEFDVLTSFQAPGGNHTTYKRVGFIRPVALTQGVVSVNVGAIYDYNINQALQEPLATSPNPESLWDTAIWDQARWDFTLEGTSLPLGSLGMGRTLAVAMRGSSTTRYTFIGWDISFTEGGFL
jgi:hypothetical protein